MNQRDGFGGGFIAGTIVGGVVGGVIGALLASQTAKELADGVPRRNQNLPDTTNNKRKRRQLKAFSSEQGIETARRSLEDKIAQLNETIDEVRLTLGEVNGSQVKADQTLREDLTR
jgi:gas vesicle protein